MSAQSVVGSTRIVYAFISLQLIGAAGLVVIVVTALLNKSVKRWATWYSFCLSWIFSALSYSLLTIAGQQFNPEPPKALCLIQAGGIYAAPTLTTCTTLSLLVHILLRLRFVRSDAASGAGKSTRLVLVTVPYCVWLVIFIGFTLFALVNLKTVEKDAVGTYCHSSDPLWAQMSAAVVLTISVIIILVQAYLGYLMYSNATIRLDNQSIFTTGIRVIVFGCIGFLSLAIALCYSTRSTHHETFDLIISTFPLLALLTFGTQKDLIDSWIFWRQRPAYGPYSQL